MKQIGKNSFSSEFIGKTKEEFKANLEKRYQNVPSVKGKKVRPEFSDKEIKDLVDEAYPEPKKEEASGKPSGIQGKASPSSK